MIIKHQKILTVSIFIAYICLFIVSIVTAIETIGGRNTQLDNLIILVGLLTVASFQAIVGIVVFTSNRKKGKKQKLSLLNIFVSSPILLYISVFTVFLLTRP